MMRIAQALLTQLCFPSQEPEPISVVDGYLYLPFTKDELTKKMIEDAELFQEAATDPNMNKNFKILYHGQCDLSKLPKQAKLYVLGHRLDISPDSELKSLLSNPKLYDRVKHLPFCDWAYSIWAGKIAVSIDTVAKRMIADGLFSANDIHIKLYFCDKNNKAYGMAERFIENFKNSKNTYRVDYYSNVTLQTPSIVNNEEHKWAISNASYVKASSVRQSLFNRNNFAYHLTKQAEAKSVEAAPTKMAV